MTKQIDSSPELYREIWEYIVECDRWCDAFRKRVREKQFPPYGRYALLQSPMWDWLRAHRMWQKESRIDAMMRFASDEDRQSPFFSVAVAVYPLADLSRAVVRRLPEAQLLKILAIHRIHERQFRTSWTSLLVTAVAGAGLFLLSRIPDTIAVDLFGSVANYERWVFWFTVATLIVLIFFLWATWGEYVATRHRLSRVGEVLQYASALLGHADERGHGSEATEVSD